MGTSLRELEPGLESLFRSFVRLLEGPLGYQTQINSVRRDTAQQTRMYKAYLAGDPRYRHGVAVPGRSPHELGIGVDMNIRRTSRTPAQIAHLDPYEVAGAIWQYVGRRWGGVFTPRDEIHFDFWPRGYVPPAGASGAQLSQLAKQLVSPRSRRS